MSFTLILCFGIVIHFVHSNGIGSKNNGMKPLEVYLDENTSTSWKLDYDETGIPQKAILTCYMSQHDDVRILIYDKYDKEVGNKSMVGGVAHVFNYDPIVARYFHNFDEVGKIRCNHIYV